MEYAKEIYDIDKEISRIKPISDLIDIDVSEYKDIYYILCKAYQYDKHVSVNRERNNKYIKDDKEYQKFIKFKQSLIRSLKLHPVYNKDFEFVIDRNTGIEDIEILGCVYNPKIEFALFDYPKSSIVFNKFICSNINIGYSSQSDYVYRKLRDCYSDYEYRNNIKWYKMSFDQFVTNLKDVEIYLKPSLCDIDSPEEFLRKKGAFNDV